MDRDPPSMMLWQILPFTATDCLSGRDATGTLSQSGHAASPVAGPSAGDQNGRCKAPVLPPAQCSYRAKSMTKTYLSLFILPLLAATPAMAADLAKPVAAAPAAAPTTTTLTFEASPEFKAAAGATQNDLADWYGKVGIGYVIAPGWTIGAAGQYTAKPAANGFDNLYTGQVEGTVAYKYKLTDTLSVTGTAGLGYDWGNTGYVAGVASTSGTDLGNDDDSFGYYFVQGAVDYKLDSHWTWNVINARYRNAFNETWITPKVATGVTYNIDATDAVYVNVGYGWKDNGNGKGLVDDTYNIAVGYKYSF